MKTIELTIAPDGETTVKTIGYTGASCKDGSRWLEESLGVKTGETLTQEYHQNAPQHAPRVGQ
jgi:hypothetical protein